MSFRSLPILVLAPVVLLAGCVSQAPSSQPQGALNDPVLACPGQLSRAQRIAIQVNNRSADSTTDQIRPRCR
ncbi:MAG: hypothetical protein AAF390_11605 [Pseudomonadota bacterium]